MDDHEARHDFSPDRTITCDICGAAIAIGADYVQIAAEDETGTIIGTIVAHPECAEHLDTDDIASLLGAAVGADAASLEQMLPLERCGLCGLPIGDDEYINLIEPMHFGGVGGPLVATSFHLACYRDDPDGVQRALDEELMRQQARQYDGADEY